MADAIVHWHQHQVGGGYWSVEVLNQQMRSGTALYIHPPKPQSDSRRDYILLLVRALEKRAENGELDEALADKIEQLLGVGKVDSGESTAAAIRGTSP